MFKVNNKDTRTTTCAYICTKLQAQMFFCGSLNFKIQISETSQ